MESGLFNTEEKRLICAQIDLGSGNMEKEIEGLLASKLEKLENLFKHTQNIAHILEEEDTEELLKILSLRQLLMEDIDSIDSRLLSFFEGDLNAFTKYITDGSRGLKDIHKNIATLLKKTQELDDKNITGAKELFSKLKGDINSLKQAENALKGYGIIGTGSHDGAFIDTKK